ncbi:MAG: substrate-binding domain-containing protein [Acidimicrobiia bacterium]
MGILRVGRGRLSRRAFLGASGLSVAGAVAACTPAAAPTQTGDRPPAGTGKSTNIVFIGSAGPEDPFHGIVYRGSQQAAKDHGATKWTYNFTSVFTNPAYNTLVAEVIASKPDGLYFYDLASSQDVNRDLSVRTALAQQALDAGIVIATTRVPGTRSRQIGDPFVARAGSEEGLAGILAGQALIAARVKGPVLLATAAPGDLSVNLRITNSESTLTKAGIPSNTITIEPNPGQSAAQLTTYFRAHPEVDSMIAYGQGSNAGARTAIAATRKIVLGTFDLDPGTLADIKAGGTLFTIDQQPWWRGYIPTFQLIHYIRYGLMQSNYYLTGPTLINKDNVDAVIELAKQGIR